MSLKECSQKIKTCIIFISIVACVFFVMNRWWGVSYDPAYVGAICLACVWFVSHKLSILRQDVQFFAEKTYRYLLDPRWLTRDHVQSYIAEAARDAVKDRVISIGMTVEQVEGELRRIIANRIKAEIKDDEENTDDAVNFASGWELMNIWGRNEKQLPKEAFKDYLLHISSDDEKKIFFNNLSFPAYYVSLSFKNKKLACLKIVAGS